MKDKITPFDDDKNWSWREGVFSDSWQGRWRQRQNNEEAPDLEIVKRKRFGWATRYDLFMLGLIIGMIIGGIWNFFAIHYLEILGLMGCGI